MKSFFAFNAAMLFVVVMPVLVIAIGASYRIDDAELYDRVIEGVFEHPNEIVDATYELIEPDPARPVTEEDVNAMKSVANRIFQSSLKTSIKVQAEKFVVWLSRESATDDLELLFTLQPIKTELDAAMREELAEVYSAEELDVDFGEEEFATSFVDALPNTLLITSRVVNTPEGGEQIVASVPDAVPYREVFHSVRAALVSVTVALAAVLMMLIALLSHPPLDRSLRWVGGTLLATGVSLLIYAFALGIAPGLAVAELAGPIEILAVDILGSGLSYIMSPSFLVGAGATVLGAGLFIYGFLHHSPKNSGEKTEKHNEDTK